MDENELKIIKKRGIVSAFSLLAQSSYSAILGFIAFFVLTYKSGIELLGIYSTVLASLSFFNYITNLGLAAALIQKKDVKSVDYNTAFYIQLFLVTIAVAIGFFFGEVIINAYKDVPPNTIYLYWSLLISLFLLSLKTIPSVLLEKNVEIYKNVIISSIENTVFYVVIIVLVFFNYTIEALIAAVLIRATLGLISMYVLKPWWPSAEFSFHSLKELLSFGLPFQGNSFLALVKDDLMIIYLGQVIGLPALGIVSFGKKYAEMAVRLVTDNINRVAFPVLSRVQDNKELLSKSLMSAVFFSSLIVFPIIIGAALTFDSFLKIVDGYFDKWSGALFSFYFFSASALLVSLTTPFINLFNASKKVTLSLLFMVLWTVLMWAFIPLLVNIYGYDAISVVFFIVSTTVIFVIWKAKEIVHFSLWQTLQGVLVASSAMLLYLSVIRLISLNFFGSPVIHLVFSLVGAPVVYIAVILSYHGIKVFKDVLRNLRP
jgi:PST family polysaccharide transporter